MTNREKARKAIEFVLGYEKKQGRNPEDVSMNRKHAGYDIKSDDRKIEVKGIGEHWAHYNWQALHKTERECLQRNPSDFYLYVVKFVDKKADMIEGFYIVPSADLESPKFNIEVETYRLSPISKSHLKEFLQPQE